jgi:hypothetical protein
VQAILQQGLQLRDRRQQGQISQRGVAIARGRLETRLDGMLERRLRSPPKLAVGESSFTRARGSVHVPQLSWSGGHQLAGRTGHPPMVVTRKVWGGDRTIPGARTQSVLGSILQTCRQQRRPVSSFLQKLICSSQPKSWT